MHPVHTSPLPTHTTAKYHTSSVVASSALFWYMFTQFTTKKGRKIARFPTLAHDYACTVLGEY